MSMCKTKKATSPTLPPIRRSSRSSADVSWCAPANTKIRKAAAGHVNVVIEFPDYATALACYNSPEYQANIKVRQPNAMADIIVVEGYDGPQP